MSKKRFRKVMGYIRDNTHEGGDIEGVMDLTEIEDMLNKLQDTINKQLNQIIELQDKYRILEFNYRRLEKRNKAQYKKIDEQQTIISDLKEKNEQLMKELDSFKPVMFQDMRKGTVILYSKGDIDEWGK